MAKGYSTLFVVAALVAACGPSISPVADHTVQVAADEEADVLWLVRGRELYRCTNESAAPVCRKASGLEDGDHWGLGQHTVQVSETKETDVVWVLSSDVLYRCTGKSGQPVCALASGVE